MPNKDNFNPIQDEIKYTTEHGDLSEIIEFQTTHSVQCYIGSDCQYYCNIDGKVYQVALTFAYALVVGIKNYKEFKQKTK